MADFKGNIKWIAIFSAVILVSLFLLFLKSNSDKGSKIALISQDGRVIQKIDLTKINEPYEFTVSSKDGGENTIRAEHGKIAVVSADCPDRICVKRGYISSSLLPIVCLPHKLTITIENRADDIDAVSGGDTN